MTTTRLLFRVHYLSPSAVKYFYQSNSIQSRCFLRTCLPLMNKGTMKTNSDEEQSHMRLEAKTIVNRNRTYKERSRERIMNYNHI